MQKRDQRHRAFTVNVDEKERVLKGRASRASVHPLMPASHWILAVSFVKAKFRILQVGILDVVWMIHGIHERIHHVKDCTCTKSLVCNEQRDSKYNRTRGDEYRLINFTSQSQNFHRTCEFSNV